MDGCLNVSAAMVVLHVYLIGVLTVAEPSEAEACSTVILGLSEPAFTHDRNKVLAATTRADKLARETAALVTIVIRASLH
jgi:hypothetical protein